MLNKTNHPGEDMTKYYKRELGEGDWSECSFEEYLRCQSLPEMDSKAEEVPSGENMYTINDFENAVNEVSEGVGNEGFNPVGSVGKLFEGIKNYFQSKLLGLDQPLVLADVNAAKKVVGRLNYTDVMDTLIFQPQRLNKSYKDLYPTLDQGMRFLLATEQALPSVLKSLLDINNGDGISIYAVNPLIQVKNKFELELQKTFNGKDTTEAVFSTRFESMTQYQAAYVEFNTLVQSLLRRNPKDVRLNVDRIAELAGNIHTGVVAGEITVTGPQVKAMSELLLAMARVVDVYSVTVALFLGTGIALNNTAEKLNKK